MIQWAARVTLVGLAKIALSQHVLTNARLMVTARKWASAFATLAGRVQTARFRIAPTTAAHMVVAMLARAYATTAFLAVIVATAAAMSL